MRSDILYSILSFGLQASAVAGGRESVVTDYMLKLLGLDVCAGMLIIAVKLSSAASITASDWPVCHTPSQAGQLTYYCAPRRYCGGQCHDTWHFWRPEEEGDVW